MRIINKINGFMFPVFFVFAYVAIFVETFTYVGALKKYLVVDSRFFLIMVLMSAILLIGGKINRVTRLIFKVTDVTWPIFACVYLYLQFLEATHFHNYVYSTYHLQQSNFLYIVLVSFFLSMISNFLNRAVLSIASRPRLFLIFVFITIFFNSLVDTLNISVYSNLYIVSHLTSNYDFKMRERWGIYYDYIQFVKKNTPERSSILVPPQELPWYSTGNVGLNRYFLYPRDLGNGTNSDLGDISNYDYIMLVWGEWNDVRLERYSWPKVPLEAEKIIYFNPSDNSQLEIKGNFDPIKSLKTGAWGLIKLKK